MNFTIQITGIIPKREFSISQPCGIHQNLHCTLHEHVGIDQGLTEMAANNILTLAVLIWPGEVG